MFKIIYPSHENEFDGSLRLSVGRKVRLHDGVEMSGAFSLPKFTQAPFRIGDFIGDIEKGGSCNVKIHNYCPHNLTHIETSQHIIQNGHSILSLSRDHFQGMLYLIDLTYIPTEANLLITLDHVKSRLKGITKSCKFLALKTKYSEIKESRNFSNTSPIALDPKLMKYISDAYPNIIGILLDLPSADVEQDGGKLLAHRNFFQIPSEGIEAGVHPQKFIVELCYFDNVGEGYYFCIFTPPLVDTDAVITDIFFYPERK